MSEDLQALRAAFATVVGIVVTPFDEANRLDEAAFVRLIEGAARAGIRVFTANGNTSEFYSLSPTERHRAVELALRAAPQAVTIGGIGGDTDTAIADGRRYADLGAQAVMVHEPVHPFWSPAGWRDYHQAIARALPDVAVVPYLRSPRISPSVVQQLVSSCPNVVAIKYAVTDPAAFATMVQQVGQDRVAWICGVAEMWAPFFAVAGAVGFTSGLVSVDPYRSLRMLSHLQKGDYAGAMREWSEIREFEALRARHSSEMNVSVVKEALAQLGACSRAVRPPLSPLLPQDRDHIAQILAGWAPQRDTASQGVGR
ncbi:4-hydroxy-tetrahydrodipicolinate synthase [Micromonospora viridifaciens]|uniref:4-hydroxy-tetrahydrodipicolinate synthase n=1 Tax=Micromonospora viridifaciens TaxID=1881 RepID=A0A1C4WZR9_MICVI|nr:dihydrodipicolinate synthase family protein [Micromonospora viridifaciens]SCF01705.1 4-hydroxy-tetrahydrodipicolinate synthase [Micromonospora viridifaciens]